MAATENEVGSAIVRELLGSKVECQLGVLQRSFTDKSVAVRAVKEASAALLAANTVDAMLALEAKAASAY